MKPILKFRFMDEKTEFAQRLRAAMIAAGHEARPAVLEHGFNMTYWGRPVTFQAVSRWLRGEAIPSQDKLQALAVWLGVEPQALRFGDRAAQQIREQHARWENAINTGERETLELFLSLAPEDKHVVREVIRAFAGKRSGAR